MAAISHADSFNFFNENSAISKDKSMITEDQDYGNFGCQVSKGGMQN